MFFVRVWEKPHCESLAIVLTRTEVDNQFVEVSNFLTLSRYIWEVSQYCISRLTQHEQKRNCTEAQRRWEEEAQRRTGAEEQRSRGAEEQRSRGAEEQRSRGAEAQRRGPRLYATTPSLLPVLLESLLACHMTQNMETVSMFFASFVSKSIHIKMILIKTCAAGFF
jgi:septum formation inhibitor MinC